jgi:alpha-L-rhamnosidase
MESMYGKIESGWKQTGDGTLEIKVTVPANTTASLRLPGGVWSENGGPVSNAPGVKLIQQEEQGLLVTLGSGQYRFVSNG